MISITNPKILKVLGTDDSKYVDWLTKYSDNPSLWCLRELNVDLYDNQIEIMNAVCDLRVRNLAVLQARHGGKTFAVGLGLIRLSLTHPGLQIGIFGPKAEQANRIIKELCKEVLRPDIPIYDKINWTDSTNSRLSFKNGSQWLAISADENAMQEGYHFHIVVLDECHQISDVSVNQRIRPMIGGKEIFKMIKIGVSLFKNNFWKSCHSSTFKVLSRDWTECPILLESGTVEYKGKNPKFKGKMLSKYVLDLMPLVLKQEYFPDRPDWHTDGDLTEFDFKTQYAMEWMSDINLELTERDQEKLIDSSHTIMKSGNETTQELYYFGLDTAPGTLAEKKKDLDWTVLSIWRQGANGLKEKVACYEWQGDVYDQRVDIEQIINPVNGDFKCVFGLVDYSNVAYNMISDWQKKKTIPAAGIVFGSREPISGKNFKNAMYDHFKVELQADRVKYPSLDKLDTHQTFKKAFNEWCHVERHIRPTGTNAKIEAPSGLHDDHCDADVLAVWAMDRAQDFISTAQMRKKLVKPIFGVKPLFGRGIQTDDPNNNRYLK